MIVDKTLIVACGQFGKELRREYR